jgi:hypothetical protein
MTAAGNDSAHSRPPIGSPKRIKSLSYALLISTTNNLTEISRFTKFGKARGDNSSENIATSSLITSV